MKPAWTAQHLEFAFEIIPFDVCDHRFVWPVPLETMEMQTMGVNEPLLAIDPIFDLNFVTKPSGFAK